MFRVHFRPAESRGANGGEMTDFSLKSEAAHPAREHVSSLDSLQRDMLEALHKDQTKQQLNDAKLRAVKQHVEYDDFERLVKGAHLKPVKPKSQEMNDIGKQFDGFVMPKIEAKPAGPALPPKAAATPSTLPPEPKTSNEFLRVWRRQLKTGEDRYAYLRQIPPETMPALFRTELDATVFDGIVGTLSERLLERAAGADDDGDEGERRRRAELAWACSILRHVARINRFELTLDFADAKTLTKIASLLEAMEAAASAGGAEEEPMDVGALRAIYKSS
jgi:hypothetical protein